MLTFEFIGLFILIAGFIIGLGAVTVIDFHGLLGRKSAYWTEATIRTHKVTKPLIWFGLLLATVGGTIFYRESALTGVVVLHLLSLPVMILNGLYLSFRVSPFLLERERMGQGTALLPLSLQRKITASFIVSFITWWGNVAVLVWYLTTV